MTSVKTIDDAVSRYASIPFDDTATLIEVGIESMSIVRIIVDLNFDPSLEIDMSRIVEMVTVADLKRWLRGLAECARQVDSHQPGSMR